MADPKKELEHYRKVFGTGDIATRSYATMVKILEQQIDFLDVFNIKAKIQSEEKADTIAYKNAKDLWEGMPDTVLKLNKLKNELGIEYVEKEEEYTPISSKQIANGDV